MSIVREYAARLRTDPDRLALEVIEEELGDRMDPELREQLEIARRLETKASRAADEIENPRRSSARTKFLRSEPEAGDIAVCVLATELGSAVVNTPIAVGESGQGRSAVRWMLDPMAGALGFIDRGTWAAVRRSRELGGSHGGRLVLLDPGRTGGFDDLWGLIFASPSKPQHPEEIGVSVARNTSSVLLLSQWAAHGDCKRDARRSRIVREALARARDATKAAE